MSFAVLAFSAAAAAAEEAAASAGAAEEASHVVVGVVGVVGGGGGGGDTERGEDSVAMGTNSDRNDPTGQTETTPTPTPTPAKQTQPTDGQGRQSMDGYLRHQPPNRLGFERGKVFGPFK